MNDYYTKSQISQLLGNYYDKGSLYNKGEIDSLLAGLGGSGSGSSQSFSGNCSTSYTVPYNALVTFTHFAIYSSTGNGNAGFTHSYVYATINGNKVTSSPVYVSAGDVISYSSGSTFSYNGSLLGYEQIGNNPSLMAYTGQKK